MRTFWRLLLAGRELLVVDIKQEESQNSSLWDAIFKASQPVWLFKTDGKDETADKLHDQ